MTDRGVSVAVSYVLTLAITTLLISGLLFATSNIVEDRRESATRAELQVVGERVASNLLMADRLVQTDASEVIVRASAPTWVAGRQYTVSLNATNRQIVLEMEDPGVIVRVPFKNTTPVSSSTTQGGDVRIALVNGELEVQSS